jgi:hypothetical protein
MGRLTPVPGGDCVMRSPPGEAVPSSLPTSPDARTVAPAIERIAGVRLLRPSAEWKGVALRLADAAPGAASDDDTFEIVLTCGDGRGVRIATLAAEDAIAVWRGCGAATGRPLLLEAVDGSLSTPYPQLGRVLVGPFSFRRRYGFLKGRRPRFLTRRKCARLGDRPVMVRGAVLFDRG